MSKRKALVDDGMESAVRVPRKLATFESVVALPKDDASAHGQFNEHFRESYARTAPRMAPLATTLQRLKQPCINFCRNFLGPSDKRYHFFTVGGGAVTSTDNSVQRRIVQHALNPDGGNGWRVLDNSTKTVFVSVPGRNKSEDVLLCALVGRHHVSKESSFWSTMTESVQRANNCGTNAQRGPKKCMLSSKYSFHGARYDPYKKQMTSFVHTNKTRDKKEQVHDELHHVLSYLERNARFLFDTLLPGQYAAFRSLERAFGVPAAFGDETHASISLAIGLDFIKAAHIDDDPWYSIVSVLPQPGSDIPESTILQYFVFPNSKVLVPLRAGDVLVFNPRHAHCAANPQVTGVYIFGAYTSMATLYGAAVLKLTAGDEITSIDGYDSDQEYEFEWNNKVEENNDTKMAAVKK